MANSTDYFLDSDLETGNDGPFGYSQGYFQVGRHTGSDLKGACRFSDVAVSQGATVSAANLYLYSEFQGSGSGNLKFKTYGIKETDTADLSSNPFGRTHTTASDTADNPLPGVGNYKQVTVTSIVNEIVGQGGWSSGNHMGFLCENNGSNDDVWLDDDSGNEILSIRLNALPDFTPGPFTTRINSIPPKKNFGIRISKNAVDALTDEIVKLNYFSKTNVLKAIRNAEKGWTASSNLEKVDHALKYPPAFMAFYKSSNRIYHANSNISTAGTPIGYVIANQENLEFVLDPNASDPQSWYYYVFVDEIL